MSLQCLSQGMKQPTGIAHASVLNIMAHPVA
jgi:hypothetical protein